MFLLIQISKKEQKNNKHIFKFHYVSINSKLTFSDIEEDNDFKFHYVSINSSVTIQCLQSIHTFKFHYVSINS